MKKITSKIVKDDDKPNLVEVRSGKNLKKLKYILV